MENMRELSMDEMDKVSGGDIKDRVRYWMKDRSCPNCGNTDIGRFELVYHSLGFANIRCKKCQKRFEVSA